MARAGRRPGSSSTADQILISARRLFADRGYQATTMRAIAAEAGVNPALVHHFFGSKQQVFVAALELPINPAALVGRLVAAGPREQLGERIVRTFVQVWRAPETGPQLQAFLRGAVTEDGAARLRHFAEDVMLPKVSAAVGVPKIRLAAAVSQLIGFALTSLIIRIEPLASASEDDVVALLAPSVQRYLDEPSSS